MRLMCFVLLWGYAYCHGCNSNPYIRDAGPLVRTSSGSVLGKYVQVFDTQVAAFLGIPYAEPPVNEKRFLKPTPLDHWEGIYDATNKPCPCMQYSSRNFSWIPQFTTPSEDCLYLNIWTPYKCCCNGLDRLPVLVWIHGGGFYSGSTDMDVYDGSILASYSRSIVVSINYRVGIFGFLNSGTEGTTANAGLLDQNLALKWVKKNIKYFGGDVQSITVMGESAGGISISMHMISPMSRNLFNRAILLSATAYQPQFADSAEVSYVKANTYAKIVNCITENSSIESDPEVLKCLKGKTPWELAKAEDLFTSKVPYLFGPTYGNEFLPISPIKAINEGHIAPVDILIGNTRDEATIFLNYMIPNIFNLDSEPQLNLVAAQQVIEALFETVNSPTSSEIFHFYFQNATGYDSNKIVQTIVHAVGDFLFNCPVMFLAEKTRNAFVYWFTHRSVWDRHAEWVGVPHFYEVPFVFGMPIHDAITYTPEDGRFSWDIIQKLTSFATTGHPLGYRNSDAWPLFTTDQPYAFDLNSRQCGVLPFPRATACEFWRPYFSPNA